MWILWYRSQTLASHLKSLLCHPKHFSSLNWFGGTFSFFDTTLKSTHGSLCSFLQNLFLFISCVHPLKNWVHQKASFLPWKYFGISSPEVHSWVCSNPFEPSRVLRYQIMALSSLSFWKDTFLQFLNFPTLISPALTNSNITLARSSNVTATFA